MTKKKLEALQPAPLEDAEKQLQRLRAGSRGFRRWVALRGPHYFQLAEKVVERALAIGDTQTAALVVISLLKKVAPDAEKLLEAEDETVDAASPHQTTGVTHARLAAITAVLRRVDVTALLEADAEGSPRRAADAASDEVRPVDADADADGLPPSR